MRNLLVALVAVLALHGSVAFAQTNLKIVTASERGTYIQIGRDLAAIVAPQSGIDLEVLPSAGSAENVRRLRYENGVKFAIVQSDVYQAFVDQATAGNREAGEIIRPLRVIAPLYNEEIYFIARADSPLNAVHEIKDARINAGPLGSGTALTTTTLYRLMFGRPLPEANATFLSNEDALVKLLTDKSIDVVVVVAGQPAKLLVDMKPEIRQYLKLLKFDADHATGRAALQSYFPAIVRASSYPNLLTEDLPGVAVRSYLVTYDFNTKATRDVLAGFARSLCRNFSTLQAKGHPKWKEVDLTLPVLGRGWSYYPPTESEIRTCSSSTAAAPPERPKACSTQQQILGLCG